MTPHQYPHSIIVIAGPTAVGKTAYAVKVARHFNTVILSADSRQCFRELNIGVARPSPEELAAVPHYFIASHSIHEKINAAWYEKYALRMLKELFAKHPVIVVTGGTGLYIKALAEGLDIIPDVDENIRKNIEIQYQTFGLSWLQEELKMYDPLFAKEGEMRNPQRMMRALEVVQDTGKSIISFRAQTAVRRPFRIVQVGLDLPRSLLYERISNRLLKMMENGFENEARQLLPYRKLNSLQTVGYKELFNYLDGHISIEQAIQLIAQNTRRYAKRQLTWFKKQNNMHWLHPETEPDAVPVIHHLLKR